LFVDIIEDANLFLMRVERLKKEAGGARKRAHEREMRTAAATSAEREKVAAAARARKEKIAAFVEARSAASALGPYLVAMRDILRVSELSGFAVVFDCRPQTAYVSWHKRRLR
jgi:hypothetical protein